MNADTLTWNDAAEQAMIPTDLDHALDGSNFLQQPNRIGDDGKLCDWNLIRFRAATAYIAAHEGEQARVSYSDPKTVDLRVRPVWVTTGTLKTGIVNYPVFGDDGQIRSVEAVIVGTTVVPVQAITDIEVVGDRATLTF